jgi:hypothetical protein
MYEGTNLKEKLIKKEVHDTSSQFKKLHDHEALLSDNPEIKTKGGREKKHLIVSVRKNKIKKLIGWRIVE